jgi:hypothetical protein
MHCGHGVETCFLDMEWRHAPSSWSGDMKSIRLRSMYLASVLGQNIAYFHFKVFILASLSSKGQLLYVQPMFSHRIITFGKRLSLSSCVSRALTARIASVGSELPALLAAARDSTCTSTVHTCEEVSGGEAIDEGMYNDDTIHHNISTNLCQCELDIVIQYSQESPRRFNRRDRSTYLVNQHKHQSISILHSMNGLGDSQDIQLHLERSHKMWQLVT